MSIVDDIQFLKILLEFVLDREEGTAFRARFCPRLREHAALRTGDHRIEILEKSVKSLLRFLELLGSKVTLPNAGSAGRALV
jgi:hypothetical protein